MRQLARLATTTHRPLPRGVVVVLALLAAVAVLAVPAGAASGGAQPCPEGLARVASWEPIQVADGRATVAFVLATGCEAVEVSLVSYAVRPGGSGARSTDQAPLVLHAATGRFSAGKVHKLTALVGSDCAFRVVFALGRPEQAGQAGAAVESAVQAPDPCMYGAAPVVVTGSSTSTTAGLAATATSLPPTTTTVAAKPKTATARAGDTARTAPATPARPARSRGESAATAATRAQARPATPAAPVTSAAGLASEPVSAVGVGPAGPPAGWDGPGLLGLGLLAMAAGAALLWLTRPRRQH